MTAKKKAWQWCSKYIRLRDAIEYCKTFNIDLRQFVRPEDIVGQCCTCGTVKAWIRMDAGHWIDRGSGGASGVYFDERNIHLQCKPCNGGLYQGRGKMTVGKSYLDFMLQKYGARGIDELRLLDRTQSYYGKIVGIGLMYKQMYEELRSKD